MAESTTLLYLSDRLVHVFGEETQHCSCRLEAVATLSSVVEICANPVRNVNYFINVTCYSLKSYASFIYGNKIGYFIKP